MQGCRAAAEARWRLTGWRQQCPDLGHDVRRGIQHEALSRGMVDQPHTGHEWRDTLPGSYGSAVVREAIDLRYAGVLRRAEHDRLGRVGDVLMTSDRRGSIRLPLGIPIP